LEQFRSAGNLEELVAAFGRRLSPLYLDRGMPLLIPSGSIYLQPTEERRRSGSHYTPRSLTEPIVRTTLEPILKQLGDKPRPEQILNLKICDPAMGSGAFLVEACRYLADALVESWAAHGDTPVVPPDQEPVLHARRMIAQCCLYGVDKNLFAVDLAKLSLWLATLAKDHPFTFLDHTLRQGDSLVGLTRGQVAAFHWLPSSETSFPVQILRRHIDQAAQHRRQILSARDDTPYEQLQQQLDLADDALSFPRDVGDVAVAVFFQNTNVSTREQARKELRVRTEEILSAVSSTTFPNLLNRFVRSIGSLSSQRHFPTRPEVDSTR
jgi:N-6 DNA Methylase